MTLRIYEIDLQVNSHFRILIMSKIQHDLVESELIFKKPANQNTCQN